MITPSIVYPSTVLCLSSSLINMDNRCNKFLPSFSLFNREFSPGNWLINTFLDHFSLNPWIHNIKNHLCKLDDITIQASSDPSSYVVISDTSIKNHIATSFSHIHSFDRPIIKTCHHAINISTTEAELFAMRCSINQVVGISHIQVHHCHNRFNICCQENFWVIIASIPDPLSHYLLWTQRFF